jgi:hypothetical protein
VARRGAGHATSFQSLSQLGGASVDGELGACGERGVEGQEHRSSFEAQGKITVSAALEADGMVEMVADWCPGTTVERQVWDSVVRGRVGIG